MLLTLILGSSAVQLRSETPATEPSVARSVTHRAPLNTTLAIFHDQPMPAGLMPELITTLRQSLNSHAPELATLPAESTGTQALGPRTAPLQILNGDQVTPGIVVQNTVTVYLHGACNLIVHAPGFDSGDPVVGALGWVKETRGHIDPFVHVDCSRIAAMLAESDYGHTRDQQLHRMAGAISLVVLHEWIHIATQDSHHSREGVSKSAFTVRDLLAASTSGTPVPPIISTSGAALGNPQFLGRLNAPAPALQQSKAVR